MFHILFSAKSFTIFYEHKSSMIIMTNLNMRRKNLFYPSDFKLTCVGS